MQISHLYLLLFNLSFFFYCYILKHYVISVKTWGWGRTKPAYKHCCVIQCDSVDVATWLQHHRYGNVKQGLGSFYTVILMAHRCGLGQDSNDHTGTLHKHIKPLNSALNNKCRVGGFIKWRLTDTVSIPHANDGRLIIPALCCEDGCCMGVRSMGAPLMSQICPVFKLRL